MTTRTGRRLATAALGVASMVLALAAPATAAPPSTGTMSITAQRLVLEPTDRGYVGTLTATVTNEGAVADYPNLALVEPAGASHTTITPGGPCLFMGLVENRMRSTCMGEQLEPGASQTYSLGFHVHTTPRDYPMIAGGGSLGVIPSGAEEPVDTAAFATLFRSTKGSLGKPRPYVQAVDSDIRVTAGDVALDRQADGSLLGRMPLTVRYGNDAPSFDLGVTAALPNGVVVNHIEPQDAPSWSSGFSVPGGRFMPGEERTFDVILTAPAGTAAGDLGTGSYTVTSSYFYGAEVQDVDPTDNTTSFTVTAVAAS